MKRFHLVMQVDLRAPLIAIRAATPAMKEQGEGAIVNVVGPSLNYIRRSWRTAWRKPALEHLTVSAAHQLRPFDIAVTRFGSTCRSRRKDLFNMPDADHSDWEPSEVRGRRNRVDARATVELHRTQRGNGTLRADSASWPSKSARALSPSGHSLTESHLRPVGRARSDLADNV